MACAPDDCRCGHDHSGHDHGGHDHSGHQHGGHDDASQQDHGHGAGCCGGTAVHGDTGDPQVAENA